MSAFPGAHSQVPRAHADLARQSPPLPAPTTLPLDATPTGPENGWVVRLPVRGEQVSVRERVRVRRGVVRDVARVQAEVLHERLRVDTHGQVDVSTASGPLGRDRESPGAG